MMKVFAVLSGGGRGFGPVRQDSSAEFAGPLGLVSAAGAIGDPIDADVSGAVLDKRQNRAFGADCFERGGAPIGWSEMDEWEIRFDELIDGDDLYGETNPYRYPGEPDY